MKNNIERLFNSSKINSFFKSTFSRSHFLKLLGLFSLLAFLSPKTTAEKIAKNADLLSPRKVKKIQTNVPLVVVEGKNPAAITRAAIEALGGMQKFVKSGDTVVIKPNIGWNRTPEYAANTNPEVVGALVAMAKDAGARRVRVFDHTCNDPKMCYINSGIQDAVKKNGGMIYHVSDAKWRPADFPKGAAMKDWPVFQDAIECDTFINVPVAKHHGLTGLTLSIKNLMGVCGGRRGLMHWNLDQKLTELLNFIKPDLNVIDAYRILLRHGPTGGNLADVASKHTVIASTDAVLADAFAATLFNIKPETIGHIKEASKAGLGSIDINIPELKKIEI